MGESVTYTEIEKSCDICESDNYRHVRTKPIIGKERVIKNGDKVFNGTDVICMDCGLVYKRPSMTQESLNSFYIKEYMSLYSPAIIQGIPKSDIFVRTIDAIHFMEWVNKREINIENKKILNVGSGLGVLSYFLKTYDANVTSLDPIPRACEIAKKIFGIESINKTLEDYSKEDNKFDIIILQNCLEHFYSAKQTLMLIRNMLVEDGILIIELPDIFRPYPKSTIDGWLSSAHTYSFSACTLMKLLSRCGFDIFNLDYDGDKQKMLISTRKGNVGLNPASENQEQTYNKLMEMFREMDLMEINMNKYKKELLETQDVIAVGNNINKQLHYTYNPILLILIEILYMAGKEKEASQLCNSSKLKEDVGSDIGVNEATFFYWKSLLARKDGDIINCKKLIDKAIELYPPLHRYNIVTTMKMNALLSDSLLEKFHYGTAIKLQKSME